MASVNLSESKQPQINGAEIVTYALAFITVALRFLSRRLVHAKYCPDDWLSLGALVRESRH